MHMQGSGKQAAGTHLQREDVLVLVDLGHDHGGRSTQHLLARADHEGALAAEAVDAVVVVQAVLLHEWPVHMAATGGSAGTGDGATHTYCWNPSANGHEPKCRCHGSMGPNYHVN